MMTENVVYLLGAGFSYPLGLPVMGNFLEKSKDMYFEDKGGYQHFEEIFKKIREMNVSKTYYDTDLTNIEEILSFLEMEQHLGDDSLEHSFTRYIIDVINHFTPDQEEPEQRTPNAGMLFGGGRWWPRYGAFVASLFWLELNFITKTFQPVPRSVEWPNLKRAARPTAHYDVITLNYDMVLERIVEFMKAHYNGCEGFSWNKGDQPREETYNPRLAKLHGSVDTGGIIPPTWNKGLHQNDVLQVWRLAYRLLKNTNHIRIIGYSLPETDSYVKYLLRAAVMKSPHLKKIDVLCYDPDGTVEKRYSEFVEQKFLRFKNKKTEDYFEKIFNRTHPGDPISFTRLESVHEDFFTNPD